MDRHLRKIELYSNKYWAFAFSLPLLGSISNNSITIWPRWSRNQKFIAHDHTKLQMNYIICL